MTRVIFSLFSVIGFSRADDAATGAAPGVGDEKDPAFDFAERVNAGFAVVQAAVDGFVCGPVEHCGYVAEVDSVLDEVGFAIVLVPLEGHCRAVWLHSPIVSIHL